MATSGPPSRSISLPQREHGQAQVPEKGLTGTRWEAGEAVRARNSQDMEAEVCSSRGVTE